MLSLPLNKQKLFTDPKRLGRWGERRCEKYLRKKGFKTIARNFSCRTGEIDLIMADSDGTIVFIEIKTRTDEKFTPAEEVITLPKKTRLIKTAKYFLKTYDIENRPCRFDIVTIVLDKTKHERISHYENAFN